MGYNVSFFINGYGTQPESLTDISVLPELPVLEEAGFIFEGWYLDEDLTTPAEAGMEINSDVTLYASWARDRRPATPTTEEDSGSSTYAAVVTPTPGVGDGGTSLTTNYACTTGRLYYGSSETDLASVLETDHRDYNNGTVSLPKTTLSDWTYNGTSGSTAYSMQVVQYPTSSSAPSSASAAYGFLYGQYIDLPPYFDAETSTNAYVLRALKAGYLPLSPSYIVNAMTDTTGSAVGRYWSDSQNSVRTYAFVRTSSYLRIYYTNKSLGSITSHPSSSTSGWVLAATWTATGFPGGVVPYRVYVQIQAGGGSGGYGGSSGGGGGGAYWAGVVNCTTNVFIQMGKPGLWANKTNNNGTSADACIVGYGYQAGQYFSFSSGSSLYIYGGKCGGTSGNASNTTSYHAGGTVDSSYRNNSYYWTCKAVSGGAGGKTNAAGTGGISVGTNWYIDNQLLGTSTTMHYITTSQSGGAGQPNGGGGGGGGSVLGTGAKGQAGTWGSTAINTGSGYGYGGGGGGNSQNTPGDGGNWYLWISY